MTGPAAADARLSWPASEEQREEFCRYSDERLARVLAEFGEIFRLEPGETEPQRRMGIVLAMVQSCLQRPNLAGQLLGTLVHHELCKREESTHG